MTAHSRARDVLGFESRDEPLTRVTVIHAPSPGLLDRAHAGWQRFLDSFEEPPHE